MVALRRNVVVLFMTLLVLMQFTLISEAHDMSKAQQDLNKTVVKEFFELAFNDKKPKEAVEKFFGARHVEHYPWIAGDTRAFVKFVSAVTQANPELKVEIKEIVAEGNLVTLFSHVKLNPGDRGLAAFDMFRVEKGKLVEHWGIDIPVPEKTASGNPIF